MIQYMIKKIISLKTFEKRKKKWTIEFSKSKKVKKLALKLLTEADKFNYSYL